MADMTDIKEMISANMKEAYQCGFVSAMLKVRCDIERDLLGHDYDKWFADGLRRAIQLIDQDDQMRKEDRNDSRGVPEKV